MVLEDAESSSEPSFEGGPQQPISLGDGTALQNIQADFYRFDYSNYAHPIPIFGPLFGYNEGRVRRMVASEWAWGRQTLKRPLRTDEENALAEATCGQMRTMSWAGPLGTAGGVYRAYKTRASWRLPFWAMSDKFDPNIVKVPGSEGRPFLTGQAAQSFWRALRYSLYGANGVVFAMCILVSLSASSVSVAISRDPRLKDFNQAIRDEVMANRQQRKPGQRRPPGPGIPPLREDPTGQGQRSAGELWKAHRTDVEGNRSEFNDASPSGGQGVDDSFANYSGQDPTAQDQYAQRTNEAPTPTRSPPSRRPPPSQQSTSGGDFMNDYDDASPTARPAQGQRKTSGGSSWDQVRRHAANTSSQSSAPREQGAPRQEGFAPSSTDEDRQTEQGDAQREFDARVERERHGGDFEGARGRRNW